MSVSQNTETSGAPAPAPRAGAGVGRVLVAVYAVLAIAATGRSVFQIIDRFHEAPVAFVLSAVAGVIYIVATIALGFRPDGVAVSNDLVWVAIAPV